MTTACDGSRAECQRLEEINQAATTTIALLQADIRARDLTIVVLGNTITRQGIMIDRLRKGLTYPPTHARKRPAENHRCAQCGEQYPSFQEALAHYESHGRNHA